MKLVLICVINEDMEPQYDINMVLENEYLLWAYNSKKWPSFDLDFNMTTTLR